MAVWVPVVRSVAGGRTLHVDPCHGRLPRCVLLACAYVSRQVSLLACLSVAKQMVDAAVTPNLHIHMKIFSEHQRSSPVLRAATILRMKHVAMTILAYAFVLTTFNVNSLLFFHRNAAANTTFGSRPITASLVGAHRIVLVVAVSTVPGVPSTIAL